jgi:hypothetical protein
MASGSLRRLPASGRTAVDRHVYWSRWKELRRPASPERVVFFLGTSAIHFFPGDVLLLLIQRGLFVAAR